MLGANNIHGDGRRSTRPYLPNVTRTTYPPKAVEREANNDLSCALLYIRISTTLVLLCGLVFKTLFYQPT